MSEFANRSSRDELLSAYLDGELGDDERALVLSWLEHDPAAQQTLDQWRQAGAAIRALPQPPAPPELAAAVAAQIDRGPAPTLTLRAGDAQRPAARSGLPAAAWAALAAAALVGGVLLVSWQRRPMVAAVQRERVAEQGAAVEDQFLEPERLGDEEAPEEVDAARGGGPLDAGGVELLRRNARDEGEPRQAAGAPLPASEPRAAPPTDSSNPSSAEAALGRSDEVRALGELASGGPGWNDAAPPTRAVAIRLVRPTGIRRFEELLLQNSIDVQNVAAATAEPQSALFSRGPHLSSPDAAAASPQAAAAEVPSASSVADGATLRSFGGGAGAKRQETADHNAARPLEAVVVEATPAQIRQLIADCEQDRANFVRLEEQTALPEAAKRRRLALAAGEAAQSSAWDGSNDKSADDLAPEGGSARDDAFGATGRALRVQVPRSLAGSRDQNVLNQAVAEAMVERQAPPQQELRSQQAAGGRLNSGVGGRSAAPGGDYGASPPADAAPLAAPAAGAGVEPRVTVLFLLDAD